MNIIKQVSVEQVERKFSIRNLSPNSQRESPTIPKDDILKKITFKQSQLSPLKVPRKMANLVKKDSNSNINSPTQLSVNSEKGSDIGNMPNKSQFLYVAPLENNSSLSQLKNQRPLSAYNNQNQSIDQNNNTSSNNINTSNSTKNNSNRSIKISNLNSSHCNDIEKEDVEEIKLKIDRINRLIRLVEFEDEQIKEGKEQENVNEIIEKKVHKVLSQKNKELKEKDCQFLNKCIFINPEMIVLLGRILECEDLDSDRQISHQEIFRKTVDKMLAVYTKYIQIIESAKSLVQQHKNSSNQDKESRQDMLNQKMKAEEIVREYQQKEFKLNQTLREKEEYVDVIKDRMNILEMQLNLDKKFSKNRDILQDQISKLQEQNYNLKKQTGYLNMELQRAIDTYKKFDENNYVEVFQFNNLKSFYQSQIDLYKELSNYEKIKKIQIEELEDLLNKECVVTQNSVTKCQKLIDKYYKNTNKKSVDKDSLDEIFMLFDSLICLFPQIIENYELEEFRHEISLMPYQKQLNSFLDNISQEKLKEISQYKYKTQSTEVPTVESIIDLVEEEDIDEIDKHLNKCLKVLAKVYMEKLQEEEQIQYQINQQKPSSQKFYFHQYKLKLIQNLLKLELNKMKVPKQIQVQSLKAIKIPSIKQEEQANTPNINSPSKLQIPRSSRQIKTFAHNYKGNNNNNGSPRQSRFSPRRSVKQKDQQNNNNNNLD